MRQNYTKKWSS